MKLLLNFFLFFVSTGCQSETVMWKLDNEQSKIQFISTKAKDIAEVHEFKKIEGGLSSKSNLIIDIDLSSVETLIPIRNERIKEFLFKIIQFPRAKISANVNLKKVNQLAIGQSMIIEKDFQLLLSGKINNFSSQFSITKLDGNKLQVVSVKPIIVNASSVGLAEGVEKLRTLANLSSISEAVPVMVYLVFTSGGLSD